MLKIAVVDDEIVFVESLINKITVVCEKLNFEFKIDKYSNGFDILENYSKYHLIFLDIEMPSIDGIATAKRINELKGSAEIPFFVFVTSHDELVFDALKSFPYSFIRKSEINDSKCIHKIIVKISKLINERCKTITIRTDRSDVLVKITDIIYIEKYKNYSYIHTNDNKYSVKSSLSFYEQLLSSSGFVRCHDGYIINLNTISKIENKMILLNSGNIIPVSRNKCKMVKDAFMKRIVDCNDYQ